MKQKKKPLKEVLDSIPKNLKDDEVAVIDEYGNFIEIENIRKN